MITDTNSKDSSVAWYRNFRRAAYASTLGSLVWTAIIVLPFAPFSYLPPIITGGGPGTWFLLGYLLYLVIGLGGFGGLSTFLYTIEMHESRQINQISMSIGFILLTAGATLSCAMLGAVGAVGGYDLTINGQSVAQAQNLLSPFVYPISGLALITILGAALTIWSMARAKAARN